MDQLELPVSSGSVRFATTRYRRLAILVTLLALVVFVGLFFVRAPSRPDFMLLPLPNEQKRPDTSALTWVKVQASTWFLRARIKLLGPLPTILIESKLISMDELSEKDRRDLLVRDPLFVDTNGLSVWMLDQSELSALVGRLEQLPGAELVARPRMQTSPGCPGSLFIGGSVMNRGRTENIGSSVAFDPQIQGNQTDLTLFIVETSLAISGGAVTNFAVGARMQIPEGKGALFLQEKRSVSGEKWTAATISPSRR